jgi:hypothetical protein
MRTCAFCGIPKRSDGLYCDVCETMAVAVTRSFFVKAQEEFFEENRRRLQMKERLQDNDPPTSTI